MGSGITVFYDVPAKGLVVQGWQNGSCGVYCAGIGLLRDDLDSEKKGPDSGGNRASGGRC